MTEMVLTTLMIYKKKKILKIYTTKTTQRHWEGLTSREHAFIPIQRAKKTEKKKEKKFFGRFCFRNPCQYATHQLHGYCTIWCKRMPVWLGCWVDRTSPLISFSRYTIFPTYSFSCSLSSLLSNPATWSIDHSWKRPQAWHDLTIVSLSDLFGRFWDIHALVDLQSRRHFLNFFSFPTNRILVTL